MKTHNMTEFQIEKMQIEAVFGLTGGELSDKPVAYTYETEDGETKHGVFQHTYEGVPEYAQSDFADAPFAYRESSVDYFTAVTDCLWGLPALRIDVAGKTYVRVADYRSSGEIECYCHELETPLDTTCPLCERDPKSTDGPGYIYLGDGYCEVVYREDVPAYSDDDMSDLASICESWHGGQSTACYAVLSTQSKAHVADALSELSRAGFLAHEDTSDDDRDLVTRMAALASEYDSAE